MDHFWEDCFWVSRFPQTGTWKGLGMGGRGGGVLNHGFESPPHGSPLLDCCIEHGVCADGSNVVYFTHKLKSTCFVHRCVSFVAEREERPPQ